MLLGVILKGEQEAPKSREVVQDVRRKIGKYSKIYKYWSKMKDRFGERKQKETTDRVERSRCVCVCVSVVYHVRLYIRLWTYVISMKLSYYYCFAVLFLYSNIT